MRLPTARSPPRFDGKADTFLAWARRAALYLHQQRLADAVGIDRDGNPLSEVTSNITETPRDIARNNGTPATSARHNSVPDNGPDFLNHKVQLFAVLALVTLQEASKQGAVIEWIHRGKTSSILPMLADALGYAASDGLVVSLAMAIPQVIFSPLPASSAATYVTPTDSVEAGTLFGSILVSLALLQIVMHGVSTMMYATVGTSQSERNDNVVRHVLFILLPNAFRVCYVYVLVRVTEAFRDTGSKQSWSVLGGDLALLVGFVVYAKVVTRRYNQVHNV
ncbi:Uncharacterized protein PBTT_02012 [Plasmodiophora brassicae]|uniref:Uncharacterized protein n=1 Tax=Plasmodiophora brassicae TaxID=37360 RepID=A0A3P3Y3F9_PLABS|nr:unnamed protein product [Plasmodiophora brassicae]